VKLASPWMLVIGLPLLAAVWWIARRGRVAVPRSQRKAAIALRLGAVACLVLALAGPQLVLATDDQTVVFLLDRSESIGPDARDAQEAFVADAVAGAPPSARWSVVVFGGDARVDRSLALGDTVPPVLTRVDPAATDIEGALATVRSLVPSAGSRRVVLLSDLAETSGRARVSAQELAIEGIVVDVVVSTSTSRADAMVDSVQLPAVARTGDSIDALIRIRSNQPGDAVVEIQAGADPPFQVPVPLADGVTEVAVPVVAGAAGFLPVTARVTAGFDTRRQNDSATGLTRVLGAPRVAVVEGVTGEGEALARALVAGGMEVDVVGAVPGEAGLLLYDGLVLVNVPAPDDDAGAALAAYVEDLGRGLVVVGGDRAYGMGRYEDSSLESLLPVSSNPDDLVRRQPVAEVLVIDTSGSMSNCHCGPGGMESSEVNKTDISRAGAAAAIQALADSDRVGVLAFSSGFDWVIPLATKPSDAEITEALGTLTPSGDTEISRALEAALEELRGAPEQLRHMVLFTDGWDPADADLLPTVRAIAAEGVTLSVLGTGEGAGQTLQRMAEIGGGRYYPGEDLSAIPEIFVEETLTVARNLVNEGTFFPVIAARTTAIEGLTEAPPVLGFVLTKAKGTSRVALEIDQGDPLLATWQRGLGRATAWTSDATDRWSAGWVTWDGYVEFWGRVVRDVLPAGRDTPPEVGVEGGRLQISAEFDDLADGATATARVRFPDGSISALPMTRVSGQGFTGSVDTAGPGAYWVSVTTGEPDGGSRTISSGAVSSYEPEFAFRPADPQLGADLAAAGEGVVGPTPAEVWVQAPVVGSTERDIWPWLVAVAMAAFLTDVALRRLVIGEGDAEEWRQGMITPRRRDRRRVESIRRRRQEAPESAPDVVSDSETLQRLMRRKKK
jgi:uncharacterized membrane protein